MRFIANVDIGVIYPVKITLCVASVNLLNQGWPHGIIWLFPRATQTEGFAIILTVAINKGHITATNKSQNVHMDLNINTCNDSEYRKVTNINILRSSFDNDGYGALLVQAMRANMPIADLRNLEKVFSCLSSHGIYRHDFRETDNKILEQLLFTLQYCGVDAVIKNIGNNHNAPDYIFTYEFRKNCKKESVRNRYSKMNLHPMVLEWVLNLERDYFKDYSDEQVSQCLKMLGRFISNGEHFVRIFDYGFTYSEQTLANKFLGNIIGRSIRDIMECGRFDFKHLCDLTKYMYYENIKKQNMQMKEAYTANSKYQWISSDGKVIVTMPRTANDIHDEAEQQHNCMKGYINDYANKHTVLAFMRRTDEPNHSWISLEVSPDDNHIRQARLKYNERLTDEGNVYVNMYRSYLNSL